jgi:serine/threonine protein kinase
VNLPEGPKRLGAYDIVAKIGGGGMATIYLGRASEGEETEHVAAIKVIKQELASQEAFIQMFLDEAHILARLDHPNVSSALEYGSTGNQHFIAMELLLGRTVKEAWDAAVARGSSFGFDLPAWICARVARGLHHAHELCDESGQPLRLIHRDVTPSNIFLTYGNEVKLFDFGLAKAKGSRHATKAGIVKGKVAYLSPEQIKLLPLDRRSDIYTLGVTLWELTTMSRLFQYDTDGEVVSAIRAGLVPDAREFVPHIPASSGRSSQGRSAMTATTGTRRQRSWRTISIASSFRVDPAWGGWRGASVLFWTICSRASGSGKRVGYNGPRCARGMQTLRRCALPRP